MTRTLPLAAAAAWILFLVVQSMVGPFDGLVPAHLAADGARDLWALVVAPLAGAHWRVEDPGGAVTLIYAALLFLVPAASVWVLRRIAFPRGTPRGAAAPAHAGAVIAVAALVSLLALGALTELSNDLYLYRAQGLVMSRAHLNPYRHMPPECVPADELLNVPWTDKTSAYGPIALWIFRAASAAPGIVSAFWSLKIIMSLPLLALLAVVALRPAWPGPTRAALAAWVGLNPLLLLEVHQNAHLEGWIGVLLLAALLLSGRRSARAAILSGFLIGVATALKISSLVVLGATATWFFARDEAGGPAPASRRLVRPALHLAAFGAVVAACYAPFWIGPATFAGITVVSAKTLRSVPYLLERLGFNESASNEFALLGTAAAVAVGGWFAWARRRLDEGMMAAVALHAVVGRTFFQPWYLVPAIFLALPEVARRAGAAPGARASREPLPRSLALVLVGSVFAVAGSYAPFYLDFSMSPASQIASLALALLPPLVVFLPAHWWMSFL